MTIPQLVSRIERAERNSVHWTAEMDRHETNSLAYVAARNWRDAAELQAEQARRQLKSILGCDAYRIAEVVGVL